MANRTKLTPEKRAKFLEKVKEFASVTKACEAVAISRTAIYELKGKDPEFAEQMELAQDVGTQRLEDEAVRRAYEGYDDPVYYQGERVDVVRKYSDTLLIFLLKGRAPEKYSDRVNVTSRVHQTVEHRAVSEADSRIGELLEQREDPATTPPRTH